VTANELCGTTSLQTSDTTEGRGSRPKGGRLDVKPLLAGRPPLLRTPANPHLVEPPAAVGELVGGVQLGLAPVKSISFSRQRRVRTIITRKNKTEGRQQARCQDSRHNSESGFRIRTQQFQKQKRFCRLNLGVRFQIRKINPARLSSSRSPRRRACCRRRRTACPVGIWRSSPAAAATGCSGSTAAPAGKDRSAGVGME